VARTAVMVAHWQAVGFCHGVMNTDNMSILGLTIDYGPFQFLDVYDPGHICNHSDRQGRYAFERQPDIAHWNLFALAQALLPLIKDQAQTLRALNTFKPVFDDTYYQLMCGKLGLTGAAGERPHPCPPPEGEAVTAVRALINGILKLLAQDRVDYPIFWRRLSHARADGNTEPVRDLFLDRPALDAWMLSYKELSAHVYQGLQANLMLKTNPKYVLRNHLGENAIRAAKQRDYSGVTSLLALLETPFAEHPARDADAGFPPDWASQIEISCSS